MEKLLQAFNNIASYLPRLDRLKATFGEVADFENALGLIYSDILEFFRRAYKFFRRKAWHIWFTCDWGLFERRFKSILEKLRIHCDLLDREAAAIHFSEMKVMREKRELEEEQYEQRRRIQSATEVFAWLSADEDSQEEHLHRISDIRQPGTCNWILEDQQICSWIEDDSGEPVVWISGIPGSGKSCLCSLIIQNLETYQDLSSMYYFCRHNRSDKETCATILKTLMVQLLRSHLDMTGLVHQAYLQKGSSHSYPAMKRMLKEIVSSIPNARIIIDGIDECDHSTQREVLGSLLDIQKHTGDHCKLLIFSREEPLIGHTMPSRIRIRLDGRTADGLNLFIENKVKELESYFPRMEPALLKLVKDRLQEKAKGMFLWVRLVCTTLRQQASNAELERAIEELPDGLGEAYGLILSRFRKLGQSMRTRVFKILFWVSAAYRPISIHEVADGIALHPGQTVLSKKTRIQNLHRDIVEVCAPLLEKASNGILDLVHFSAKEYLVHEQSGPFIDIAQAHFSLAFSCIVNLTSALIVVPRYSNGATAADLENSVLQRSFGIQPYGHSFWADHVLAYLEHVREPDHQLTTLIEALQAFSIVRKTQSPIYPETITGSTYTSHSKSLDTLRQYPHLFNFISGWTAFKSKIQSAEAPIGDLQSQKDWQLQADETYLSLVDYRLREIAERLVGLKGFALPLHIDQADYHTFLDRFSFDCRFLHCNQQFNSAGDRDTHEPTHVISFPCLQCDFSDRGFKSRKDLERHTKTYHMCAEDFEIPSSFCDVATDSQNNYDQSYGQYPGFTARPTCWNKRGRKVLQKGFQQVLTKLESGMTSVGQTAENLSSAELNQGGKAGLQSSSSLEEDSSTTILNSIREKVEGQQYETLTDFRDDVWALSRSLNVAADLEQVEQIQTFCDKEFERAVSDHPIFANFNFGSSKLRSNATYPDGIFNVQQRILEPCMDFESNSVIPSKSILGKRKPYWSVMEEEEFTELLKKCGRDFIKIADRLKTKTIDEVDQHLVDLISSGRTELLRLADAADASLQDESKIALSGLGERNIEPEKPLSAAKSLKDSVPEGLMYSAETLEAMNFHRMYQKDSSSGKGENHPNEEDSNKAESPVPPKNSDLRDRPKETTRRPRRRAFCPYCARHTEGLHDEYALEKHYARFHRATRQVWICDDISINKKFLAKCKPCVAGKRYSAKHIASKHLRGSHFGAEASAEKLSRWMRKTEEPNPNFDKNAPEAASADKTRPFLTWQVDKHQKLNGMPDLHEKASSSNHSNLLPSMQSGSNKLSISGQTSSLSVSPYPYQDSNEDETDPAESSSGEESDTIEQTPLFPNIPFDSFLPSASIISQPIDRTGPPHRTNLALIKPEHVDRLPHLDTFRKMACLDQVEALYRILDDQRVGGKRYQEALGDLTSLSRTLVTNLMDWRRRSNFVPTIPVSI